MSVLSEINRIKTAVANAITAIKNKGVTVPTTAKLADLPTYIGNIKTAKLQSSKSVIPSETATTVTPDSGYDGLSQVSVAAIPNTYVGSGITRQAAKTITPNASEQTAVASGVYTTGAVKVAAIQSAERATPSITVSTAGLITARTIQAEGYVEGGVETKTKQLTVQSAKTVTPTTSEQTAVEKGVFTTGEVKVGAIPTVTRASTSITTTADDTNDKLTLTASNNQGTGYVNGSNQTASKVITLTASGATVTATDNSSTPVKISKSVATASRAGTSITTTADDTNDKLTLTASNNQSTGYVTGSNQTASKVVTLSIGTPTISSSGLISATATATDNSTTPVKVSKSVTKQLTTQAAKTVTPTTSNQTAVASGRYTTGAVTVKGDSNLKAENIKENVTIFGVTGTYAGSGGGASVSVGTVDIDLAMSYSYVEFWYNALEGGKIVSKYVLVNAEQYVSLTNVVTNSTIIARHPYYCMLGDDTHVFTSLMDGNEQIDCMNVVATANSSQYIYFWE